MKTHRNFPSMAPPDLTLEQEIDRLNKLTLELKERITELEVALNTERLRTKALNEDLDMLDLYYHTSLNHIAELEAMLRELADDLDTEISGRYDPRMQGNIHPAMLSRYDRDMDPVKRARALLDKET